MNILSPTAELRVVNAMIDTIERTLAEFADARTKSELYRELSVYHSRQDELQAAVSAGLVENETFAEVSASSAVAIDSLVEIDQDPDLPALDEEALNAIDLARFDDEGPATDLYPRATSFSAEAYADVPDVEDLPSEDNVASGRFL